MRHSSLFSALIAFLSFAPLHANDGLFSEVAMESVFATSTSPSPTAVKDASATIDRITSVSTLIETLKVAGLEAQEEAGQATFTLSHAGWRLPVRISVLVDQDRLDCRLSLVQVNDPSQISSERLLKLLASGDMPGTSFSYDPASKAIQVRASLSNRTIKASELKADLVKMASFAERNAALWSTLQQKESADSGAKPVTKPAAGAGEGSKQAPSSKPASVLTGRWSASLANDEAFAIAITADSRFQLVHLKSGKSTVSKGRIARSVNQIQLIGDKDLTLNCNLKQATADTFTLEIKDAQGSVALTLRFKKAK